MRILFVHPNYRSGGAEIAGTWPPAWVAYLSGHLRRAGFDDIHFIDTMTDNLADADLAERMKEIQPDVVGVTAITPSIYRAEDVLRIASEAVPEAVRVMGGVHATFMFKQVLSEAPWVDVIVRGEGEEICTELMQRDPRRALAGGPAQDQGARLSRRRGDRRDRGGAHGSGPVGDQAGLVDPRLEEIHLSPAQHPRRHSQSRPRLPLHLLLLFAVEVLAGLPRPRPEGCGRRDRGSGDEPRRRLLHPRRRGTDHQQEEIRRLLRGADRPRPAREGEMGHQHPRHRHLSRPRTC